MYLNRSYKEMNIVIKQEQVKDYKITEEVVKNAYWR